MSFMIVLECHGAMVTEVGTLGATDTLYMLRLLMYAPGGVREYPSINCLCRLIELNRLYTCVYFCCSTRIVPHVQNRCLRHSDGMGGILPNKKVPVDSGESGCS